MIDEHLNLKSDRIKSVILDSLRLVYDSPYTVWFLLILGILRTIVFLQAYAPAHGADAMDYYMQASYMAGVQVPSHFASFSPIYPSLIYFTHYGLGNLSLLIIVQIVLSAVQGILFYVSLRRIQVLLAFITALLVIGDAQTGILYNFTSTEPPYMFLLSVAFALFIILVYQRDEPLSWSRIVLLGVVLAGLMLTRTIARFLVVPFVILYLLSVRNLWGTLALLATYILTAFTFTTLYDLAFKPTQSSSANDLMIAKPLYKYELLDETNGEASASLIKLHESCPLEPTSERNNCLIDTLGSRAAVLQLYRQAYAEMIQSRSLDYARLIFELFTQFLTGSGQQYFGDITPAMAQCQDVESTTAAIMRSYIEEDWLLRGGESPSPDVMKETIHSFVTQFCPPARENQNIRALVETVSLRYRSISRPYPYIWYAVLTLTLLVFPWARRYLWGVLIAGGILAYHATINAFILNVQPRYIAIMNPYKGILLLVTVFIGIELLWRGYRGMRSASLRESLFNQ